jgi:transposase, IS5 family
VIGDLGQDRSGSQRVGLELRQSYRRLGKRALQKQGRYAHPQQLKRARRETRKLRTYLGRIIRYLQRKAATSGLELDQRLAQYLERALPIYEQQRADKHKLYSMQAPEVECIEKALHHPLIAHVVGMFQVVQSH